MSPRIPALLLVLLVALIVAGRLAMAPAPVRTTSAVPAPDLNSPPQRVAPSTVRTHARVQQLPGVADAPSGTPTIDLEARLAVRRRILREGDRVYVDSLLAHSDSTVVRWRDRPDRTLRVFFTADTTVRGWSTDALNDALAGMMRWQGNPANLQLARTQDPGSADITVTFVPAVIADSTYGVTELNWDGDGTARHATIQLALQRTDSGPPLPRDVRTRVAAHEFGHALGLSHSGSNRDLMYRTARVDAPSRRDQATLQLLYAIPPGPLRIP